MRSTIKKTLETFPSIFQTRIIRLLGAIMVLLFLGFLILFGLSMPVASLPMFACCLFLIVYLIWLYFTLATKHYIATKGVCIDTERKLLSKRRIHSFSIDTSKGRIIIRKETKTALYSGDNVVLYLLPNTPIYFQGGTMIITTYLGLEILPSAAGTTT